MSNNISSRRLDNIQLFFFFKKTLNF